MSATLIDGDILAGDVHAHIAREVAAFGKKGIQLRMASVSATDNPGCAIYMRNQKMRCEQVGIACEIHSLGADTTEAKLTETLLKLGADERITGIILQMPLPETIDPHAMIALIPPHKDIEGTHPHNLGKVVYGEAELSPCTARAAFEIAKSLPLEPTYPSLPNYAKKAVDEGRGSEGLVGKNVTIVGSSEIVGKPLALLFADAFATVTVCHIGTPPERLKDCCLNADVLCTATGAPQAWWHGYRAKRKADPLTAGEPPAPFLITPEYVREGAAVIDIAINRIPKGYNEDGVPLKNDNGKIALRTTGDVDFDAVRQKAGLITKMPGGVGPMTVAMLLTNMIRAAKFSARGK